jgi:tight adherence protein B
VSPRDFLAFSVGAGLAVGAVAQVVHGWPLVSVLGFGLGLGAPLAYYVHRRDRRRAVIQEALVEAIAQLRDMIRTGLSVPEALTALAQLGPEALRPELAMLAREMRLHGFEPALLAMRERLADPVWDTCCAALLLNDRLGGRNVSQVLDRLAQATRAQLRVQQELYAYQTRNVLSARIVAAVPLVVLVAIRSLNPRYLAMFSDLSGQLLLGGCVVSVALGYLAMLWLSRLPGEERVLA